MGPGKVSGTPAHLRDLRRWVCSARGLQSGGPDFLSSDSQLHRRALGQNETWRKENRDQGAAWDLRSPRPWPCPRLRDPATVLRAADRGGGGVAGRSGDGRRPRGESEEMGCLATS